MWARIHLIPLLQAEEDRDQVRRHWAEQARERELMGVETKVYNSDRWVDCKSSLDLGSVIKTGQLADLCLQIRSAYVCRYTST